MTVFKKAITGFNHNIKHKGKVYHIQTEDSGVGNPHIITHLFVGGNILASKKTSYADIVNAENLQEVVRELMEEQHKEMLRNLINGVYDDVQSKFDRATSYAPGEIKTEAGNVQLQVGGPIATEKRPAAAPPPPQPAPVPAEVLAAREFQNLRPKEGGETLFGEDLISEKSLDEVILQYLAGDGDS